MFLYLMGMPEDRLPEFVKLSEVFMRSNDEAERAQNIQQIYARHRRVPRLARHAPR